MKHTNSPPAALPRNRKPRRKRALAAPPSTLPARLDGTARDPDDYEWLPVLRKRRADGWSPTKQRMFIEALADTGSVFAAARAVDMSERSCYTLRRAPGSESFCAAWSAAVDEASKRLVDTAFERPIVGTDEPVFDKQGNRVGRRLRQSDKLLMFLLRAYMPERFRHAAASTRHAAEVTAPPLAAISLALDQLEPRKPDAPHRLMPPDELEIALLTADINEGKLPHWLADVDPERERRARMNPMPMGEAFERQLEDAKREASGYAPLSDEEWEAHRNMLLG